MRTAAIALCAGLLGFSFGAKQDPKESIMQADRDFDQATAGKGVEGWVSWFAADGMMIRGPGDILKGHAAIRQAMTPLFSKKENSLRWKPDMAEVSKSADLGYTSGASLFHGLNADGKLIERDGRYVTIWRKDARGTWKVALDIGSSGQPRPVN